MVEFIWGKVSRFETLIMQQVFVYFILASAVFYLGWRVYLAFFKKETLKGCGKCPVNQNS